MPAAAMRVKKKTMDSDRTPEQIIENLKHLLKEEEYESKFLLFIATICFVISIGLGISLYNMNRKFNDQKEIADYYKIREGREEFLEHFEAKCKELSEVSGKGFYTWNIHHPEYVQCRLGEDEIVLNSTKEIQGAIRHYKLGSVGGK